MREKVLGVNAQRVHSLVAEAKRHGRLVPQPCEVCGTSERIHAHHENYNKPLKVRWLCPAYHRARHKEIGKPLTQANGLHIRGVDPETYWKLKATAAALQMTMSQYAASVLKKEMETSTVLDDFMNE